MNPGRFFMPSYIPTYYGMPIRNIGVFQRLFNGIRNVNWGGLLNNANKTLNVVNQTIPLVRQAGPMFTNLRSMLRVAKAFGNETNKKNENRIEVKKEPNIIVDSNDSPNFFL